MIVEEVDDNLPGKLAEGVVERVRAEDDELAVVGLDLVVADDVAVPRRDAEVLDVGGVLVEVVRRCCSCRDGQACGGGGGGADGAASPPRGAMAAAAAERRRRVC